MRSFIIWFRGHLRRIKIIYLNVEELLLLVIKNEAKNTCLYCTELGLAEALQAIDKDMA